MSSRWSTKFNKLQFKALNLWFLQADKRANALTQQDASQVTKKVTPVQLPPFSQSQRQQEMNLLTCTHRYTHTHTEPHADTLTDGMKHGQRCERTASMKQMGANCGNEEVKSTQTYNKLFMHTVKHTIGRGGGAALGLQSRDSKERPRFRHKPTDTTQTKSIKEEKTVQEGG